MLIVTLVAFSLLALAWVVYPAAMYLRGRSGQREMSSGPAAAIAVVLASREAPSDVAARVADLRRSSYPAHLTRIVVAVDARSDFSIGDYAAAVSPFAEVVAGDPPGGKAMTLNAGMRAAAASEIAVFADTGQRFDPGATAKLVGYLGAARFGGVTGRYIQGGGDRVMTLYASLEAAVRAGQAAGHSVVSTSGSIYAMRTALWRPLPPGLICDDLFTTMSIVRQGYRVGFCAEALAFDPRSFTRDQQFARRVRTLTGLIQYCTLEPGVLVPWRNPIWLHFVMHKLLRLATPLLLAAGLVALLVALFQSSPLVLAGLIVGVIAAFALGRLLAPGMFGRLAATAAWSVRLLTVPVLALNNGLHRRWGVWGSAEPAAGELAQPEPMGRNG